jgi:dihydrofolate reductase
MRKLKMHLHISLDGRVETGPGGFQWATYTDAIAAHARSLTAGTDTVVFGPRTYAGMAAYWPNVPADPRATEGALKHAAWVNAATKVLVSTTAGEADATWDKTIILRRAEDLAAIKQQPGGDLMSFGNPRLVASCLKLGLVDELHLFLNPIILGGAPGPFDTLRQTRLKLFDSTPLEGGVVALVYGPAA